MYQESIERLDSIPGIAIRMAEQILAEIGTDVEKQFEVQPDYVHGPPSCQDTMKVQEKGSPPEPKREINI